MESTVLDNHVIDQETLELWLSYKNTKDLSIRNQLVTKYLPIVNQIGASMFWKYHYTDNMEELINEGTIALIHSIDRFDLDRNIKFETYVSRRVQGAMLDYINKQRGYVRKIHELTKLINTAKKELEHKFLREPTNEELASHLNITINELQKKLQEMQPLNYVSLEDSTSAYDNNEVGAIHFAVSDKDNPEIVINNKEVSVVLANYIDTLTKEQQIILALFYKEDLTVREISDILEITPERVSQVRFQAVKKLKKIMNKEEIYD